MWYDPIITIGKHAFITEIIETAGAKSVTDDLIPDWPQISMEAVIARAPEALLLVRGGKVAHRYLTEPARLEQPDRGAKGKVYYVDSGHPGSEPSRHQRIGGIGQGISSVTEDGTIPFCNSNHGKVSRSPEFPVRCARRDRVCAFP